MVEGDAMTSNSQRTKIQACLREADLQLREALEEGRNEYGKAWYTQTANALVYVQTAEASINIAAIVETD